MLPHDQVRNLIIKPAITLLRLYSDDAIELLMFTCAAESKGGSFIKQVNGPALGIFQMEPATHNDIWHNYIYKHSGLTLLMTTNFHTFNVPDEERLIYDLYYSAAMARLHYNRVIAPLPDKNDVNAIWDYYKKYYNTPKGAAKKNNCIKAYTDFLNL